MRRADFYRANCTGSRHLRYLHHPLFGSLWQRMDGPLLGYLGR